MGNSNTTPTAPSTSDGLSDTDFLQRIVHANSFGCPNLLHEVSQNAHLHGPQDLQMISAMYASCLTAHVDNTVKTCLPPIPELDGNIDDSKAEAMIERTINCLKQHGEKIDTVINRMNELANKSQRELMPDAAKYADSHENEVYSSDTTDIAREKFDQAATNCKKYAPEEHGDERFFTLCVMANTCATSYQRCYEKNQNEVDDCLQKDPTLQDCLKKIRETRPNKPF
jgi:hypothetical protein